MKASGILAKINNISIAGYDALDAEGLFDISLKMMLDLFDAKRGAIYLVDENGRDLTLKASVGLRPGEHELMALRLTHGIIGKVGELKRPIRIAAIKQDDRAPSFVCAPIMLKDKLIGAINIIIGNDDDFGDEDLGLLDFISSQTALNYLRVRVNQQLKSQLGKSTEEVMVQERLASIGRLAGGIAHEFNNPLDGVMRYTNLCLEHVREDDVVHGYLLEIRQGLKRMANTVQSLLACARNTRPGAAKTDVNKTVEAVLRDNNASLLKKGIAVHRHLMKDLPEITDQGLERVIGNLVRNAVDAIEGSGGTIDIRTSMEHQVIKIRVKDNGRGIPRQDLERIFEPFYTTKKIGQGCGLGLTIVQEIVKYSNGFIDVESSPGKGTVFTVILPI